MSATGLLACCSQPSPACSPWLTPSRKSHLRQRQPSSCAAAPFRRRRLPVAALRQGEADFQTGPSGENGADRQQPKKASQRRRSSGLRREDLAFFIARSDLTWEQPWRFEQSAALHELHLRQQGLAALDDAAAAAEGAEHAVAHFSVQLPSGLGALVVRGSVEATLPLRCEFCQDAFVTAVAEPFDGVVHLEGVSTALPTEPGGRGGREAAELALQANELIFPADENVQDITPIIVDAVLGALPTVCLCGGARCRRHAEVAWTSSPAAAPDAAVASPFAQLLTGQAASAASGKKGRRKGKR